MSKTITLLPGVGSFAENKDYAKKIRTERILPLLKVGERVIIDFTGIEFATQSFIHALIGEPLKIYGDDLLDSIEFSNCSNQLKNVIELVVNYSLGGFPSTQ
jgi:hypothetical protein